MLTTPRFPGFSGLLLWLAWVAVGHAAELGPLYHQFKLTLEPGHRTELLGPLYYFEQKDSERLWAVPPLFSYGRDEEVDYEQFDLLWKLLSYDRFGDESRLQILQLFSIAGGGTQTETNLHRVTLFPIYFHQRSAIPEKNYAALLPVAGRIQGRFFRDEIRFFLFPLYGQSRKRDVVTDNYLYPLFHLRRGDGLKGWQFWPLFGDEHKTLTSKTNVWGDVEPIGGHRKFFALWPFFHHQRTGLGTTNEAAQQALLPFYSFLRSPLRDSTTYFWPLGVTHTLDREKRYDEWGAPWPLIVFTRGEGKTISRVWPFFSHAQNPTLTSDWYLWPVYKYNRFKADPLERERTRILFFLYSHTALKNAESGEISRRIDLWPLFTARRDMDGNRRVQFLSLLEPILPNNPGVERNLSPLWSLWRAERNPKTGATSQSFLWNLYRRETSPETRKCSLLFGLFQYQSSPDGKQWRVFYIPVSKKTRRTSEGPVQP
jgi:hypothetical protein